MSERSMFIYTQRLTLSKSGLFLEYKFRDDYDSNQRKTVSFAKKLKMIVIGPLWF